jgi:hypothetical protein
MDCRSLLSRSGRQYITIRTTLLNKKDYTSKMAMVGHIFATLCNLSYFLPWNVKTSGSAGGFDVQSVPGQILSTWSQAVQFWTYLVRVILSVASS